MIQITPLWMRPHTSSFIFFQFLLKYSWYSVSCEFQVYINVIQFVCVCVCVYGFTGGSDGKASACSVGDLDSTPGSARFPGDGHGNPLQYSCLENPHGQRSLVGYSPWSPKELDMTEQLTFSPFIYIYIYKGTSMTYSQPRVQTLSWKQRHVIEGF